MKIGIQAKILFSILTTTVAIFGLSIGLVSFRTKNVAFNYAKRLTDAYAYSYASLSAGLFNIDFGVAAGLAQTFSNLDSEAFADAAARKRFFTELLAQALLENEQFAAVSLHLELSRLDTAYAGSDSLVRWTYFRNRREVAFQEAVLDGRTQVDSFYRALRVQLRPILLDPYFYSYPGSSQEQFLETSLRVPIVSQGEFAGMLEVNFNLRPFQRVTDAIRPFDKSYAFLLSNNARFVAYPQKTMVNQPLGAAFPLEVEKMKLNEMVALGESVSFFNTTGDRDFYVSLYPVKFSRTGRPWSLGIVAPVDVVMAEANFNFWLAIGVGAAGLLAMALAILLTSARITDPLKRITRVLNELDKGRFDESQKLEQRDGDEVGDIARSVNKLIEGLSNTAVFAKHVGEGRLDQDFELLSQDDVLGNALLEMRERLKEAREQEDSRKVMVERQNWSTRGIAIFSEILRQNNDDLRELAFNVIRKLCKYLGVNQGGIFLLNDSDPENPVLELTAAYAFDRRKYLDDKFVPGESLVGRCFQENETIYMTDIPQGYTTITSGLGEKTPTSLALVPLKYNQVTQGVIELASFHAIEPYRVEFVQKVGESIAASLLNVKAGLRTSQLLEETRRKSDELAQKEELMRQSIARMEATQAESSRREEEMAGLWAGLEGFALVSEFSPEGVFLNVNSRYLDVLGLHAGKVLGWQHPMLLEQDAAEASYNRRFWEDLNRGITRNRIHRGEVRGSRVWVHETYTRVMASQGQHKVLCIGMEVSEDKEEILFLEKEVERLKNMLRRHGPKS